MLNKNIFLTRDLAPLSREFCEQIIALSSQNRYDELPPTVQLQEYVLKILEYATLTRSLVIPPRIRETVSQTREMPAFERYQSACFRMYAEYMRESGGEQGLDEAAIREQMAGQMKRCEARWAECVPDEDAVTEAQLNAFYGGLGFLDSIRIHECGDYAMALRGCVSVLGVNRSQKGSVFDYGGGGGLCTSVAASLGARRTVLIDANPGLLDFARWRDAQCHIRGVEYCPLKDADTLGSGQFDFGICTEVLEHVVDPPAVARKCGSLLKPGGLLFMSASFRQYPHFSHVKNNRRYTGNEDMLMAAAGFSPFAPAAGQLPFPFLDEWKFYVKTGMNTDKRF